MTIQVTGKNVDAGDSYKSYAVEKIRTVVEKYIDRDLSGHIRLEKERGVFTTTCSVKFLSGLLLEAHGEGDDAYSSVDAAAHRLETRIRRYKSRIKSHTAAAEAAERRKGDIDARDYVVSVDDGESMDQAGANPLIIAESQRNIGELSVSEAVMQLDLTEAPFMIFRNAGHGGLNVVYRRGDGNIGWIDAEPGAKGKANGAAAAKIVG